MLKMPPSLRLILLVAGSTTTIGLMALMAFSVNHMSSAIVTELIGQNLAVLADQARDKIERTLSERAQDLETVAHEAAGIGFERGDAIKDMLDDALRSHPDIGGMVLVAADGSLTASVGDDTEVMRGAFRDWLRPEITMSKPDIRVIHDASNSSPQDPARVAIGVPVHQSEGRGAGILVAALNASWAEKLGRDLKSSIASHSEAEIVLLTTDAHSIAGLDSPRPSDIQMARLAGGTTGRWVSSDAIIDAAGGATSPVTGEAGSIAAVSGLTFKSLQDNLAVLLRQSSSTAMKPLTHLQQTIIVYVLFFVAHAMLFHLILSVTLTSPLLRLAKAADDIRTTDGVDIPNLTQFAEAKTLSDSLGALVAELKSRQASLEHLKAGLEDQVTSRTKALEEQNRKLAQATQTAERAIEAKSRLLAVASHDLRQPLHALSLFCVALKRRVAHGDAAEIVMQVEQSLESLVTMLDELLHVARLDAGLVDRTLAPLFLPHLIERIGAEFAYEADQKGLRFDFHSTRCHVLTDAAHLEIIVRNLLSNAFKFTSSGGIVLAARRRGNKALIEVYDTGPGIEPTRLERIFDEFERSSDHARGPNAGLGLGLSIVERHARLIDAEVAIRSVLGRGSRFSVALNTCKSDDAQLDASPIPVTHRRHMSDVQVMVLDDNPNILHALRLDLSDRGAQVRAFTSAEAATRAIRGGLKVDVAVVDYDLGDHDTGIAFLRRHWHGGDKFPALILTGRTDARTLSEITCSGISWMTKPANPDALAVTIDRLSHLAAVAAPPEITLN